MSDPARWVGLGFVATPINAPPQVMAQIDSISGVAVQIAWGMDANDPIFIADYIEELADESLLPVGWAWCDARDVPSAREEGKAHARIARDLGLRDFIANMEEPYDAHGDSKNPRFHMPDAYWEGFDTIYSGIHLAVTTTERWGSNHQANRDAGCTHMPQAFTQENGTTISGACTHALNWGWSMRYVRPLVQVYETNGVVPDPNAYLKEADYYGVGVIPYILEQALGGAGRAALTALVPAIVRQPLSNGGTVPPPGNEIPPVSATDIIGSEHGITAFVDWLQRQPGMPVRDAKYNAAKPGTWPWPERLERTLRILAADHDSTV